MEVRFDLFNMLVEYLHPTLVIVLFSTFCTVRLLFSSPFFIKREKHISLFFLGVGTVLTVVYLILGAPNNVLSVKTTIVAFIQGPIVGFIAWMMYNGERFIRNFNTKSTK